MMEKHVVDDNVDVSADSSTKTARVLRIAAIVGCVLLFAITAIFNGLGSGFGKQIGLYVNSTGGVSDFYYVEVTPAGWAFSIWGIIYFFQAAFLIYLVVNIFRKTPRGSGVYYDPNFISLPFLLVYGSNFIINTSWIFLFDRSINNSVLLSVACLFLWLILGLLIASIVLNYLDLDREAVNLLKLNMRYDIWLVRILAHNGMSLYATWCAVASPLNTAIALAHVQKMNQSDACTIALSILAVEIVVYVSLDTFLLDRWTRYTIAPHCVLVWALTASTTKNYVTGARNSIFTVVLLAIAVAALIEKIILMIVRHVKTPLYSVAVSDSSLKSNTGSTSSTKKLAV